MGEFWEWFDSYAAPKLSENWKSNLNRRDAFRQAFRYLDKFKNPVIIETGCINKSDIEEWSAHGCSTILFDKYVSLSEGRFWSVDNDPINVQYAKTLINGNSQVFCNDSIEFLEDFANNVDYPSPHLIYFDSFNLEQGMKVRSQVHHFLELMAISPKVTRDTLVMVDDSPAMPNTNGGYVIDGKGALIAKYADELGVPLFFSMYQSAWLGFSNEKKGV